MRCSTLVGNSGYWHQFRQQRISDIIRNRLSDPPRVAHDNSDEFFCKISIRPDIYCSYDGHRFVAGIPRKATNGSDGVPHELSILPFGEGPDCSSLPWLESFDSRERVRN